jgi:hypothetical protein
VTELSCLALLLLWSSKIGYGISGKRTITILANTLAAGFVMGVFIFVLRDLTIWALVPLSALLYFIMLFIIRGIDGEDILLLKQMVLRQQTGIDIVKEDSKSRDFTEK